MDNPTKNRKRINHQQSDSIVKLIYDNKFAAAEYFPMF